MNILKYELSRIEPLLSGDIKFIENKEEYLKKSKLGLEISNNIKNNQSEDLNTKILKYDNKISRSVTKNKFEKLLDMYEINQEIYKEKILINKDLSCINDLINLELFFVSICEPSPIKSLKIEKREWYEREEYRTSKGISTYCDNDIKLCIKTYVNTYENLKDILDEQWKVILLNNSDITKEKEETVKQLETDREKYRMSINDENKDNPIISNSVKTSPIISNNKSDQGLIFPSCNSTRSTKSPMINGKSNLEKPSLNIGKILNNKVTLSDSDSNIVSIDSDINPTLFIPILNKPKKKPFKF